MYQPLARLLHFIAQSRAESDKETTRESAYTLNLALSYSIPEEKLNSQARTRVQDRYCHLVYPERRG